MYPDETAGWVKTDASRSTATPGCNYENPNGTREYVIISHKRVRDKDTHKIEDRIPYFKYNPHTEPGERVDVTGFDTVEEAKEYGLRWMRDNPVEDTDMGDNSGGLMAFTDNGGPDSNDEGVDEDDDSGQEQEEIPQIQQHSSTLLPEYSKSGEHVGESPGARGITRPGEMPAKEDWPDGWVDKTDEFEHYEEGKDDRVRNRKRVTCECGLHMDVTGTCLTLICFGCSKSLIDMNPADSPGETTTKKDNSTNKNLNNDEPERSDNGEGGEEVSEQDGGEESGLRAFVSKNS